jgi:hypothetical protein
MRHLDLDPAARGQVEVGSGLKAAALAIYLPEVAQPYDVQGHLPLPLLPRGQ